MKYIKYIKLGDIKNDFRFDCFGLNDSELLSSLEYLDLTNCTQVPKIYSTDITKNYSISCFSKCDNLKILVKNDLYDDFIISNGWNNLSSKIYCQNSLNTSI